jgi:hypothetical protein
MILVAVVILVGVFFVATGRGGELAYEHADHAPLDLGPVSATDVVLLRPPTALWGYNMQVTDEALERIAQSVRDRDVTIAFLQQRLADLTGQPSLGLPSGPGLPAAGRAPDPGQPAASGLEPAASGLEPAASGLELAAQPPLIHHQPQHARSADAGDPPGPEHPADPPQAYPGDSAFATEEQAW